MYDPGKQTMGSLMMLQILLELSKREDWSTYIGILTDATDSPSYPRQKTEALILGLSIMLQVLLELSKGENWSTYNIRILSDATDSHGVIPRRRLRYL